MSLCKHLHYILIVKTDTLLIHLIVWLVAEQSTYVYKSLNPTTQKYEGRSENKFPNYLSILGMDNTVLLYDP
jgi:hypothetical protein